MLRVADAPRHRDVAHNAEHPRHRLALIGGLRQVVEVVRGAHEPVGGLDRAGQIGVLIDVVPLGIEFELLVIGRAVCHHLVLAAVVDDRLAVEVFDDRRVTGCVGHRQVHRRLGRTARSEVDRHDVDRRVGERVDDLVDGLIGGQYVLNPGRERQAGPIIGGCGPEVGLAEVEQVGHQAGFVHAVENPVDRPLGIGGARDDDRAVLGGPFQRIHPACAVLFQTARIGVEVRVERIRPVHRPPGDDRAVRPQPSHPTTGVRRRRQHHRHEHRQSGGDYPVASFHGSHPSAGAGLLASFQ